MTSPTTQQGPRYPEGGRAGVDTNALLGGLAAGVIAGLVMGMLAMTRSAIAGQGFWFPLQQMAATFFGVEALIGGVGVVLVGMMIHLVTSAAYGLLFGLLVSRQTSVGVALLWGLLYGVVIWAIMTFIALPLINPIMRERVALIPGWWFVYHLAYGGTLCLTPLLSRAFAEGRGRRWAT